MNYDVLRNPRIRINMLGWESDTLTLASQGWRMSIDEDLEEKRIVIIFYHENFGAVYSSLPHRVYVSLRRECFDRMHINGIRRTEEPELQTYTTARDLYLSVKFNPNNFEECSAIPDREFMQTEGFDTLKLFKPLEVPENKLIVDPNSVPDLLSRIQELQTPEVMRIYRERAEKKRREFDNEIIKPNLKTVLTVNAL